MMFERVWRTGVDAMKARRRVKRWGESSVLCIARCEKGEVRLTIDLGVLCGRADSQVETQTDLDVEICLREERVHEAEQGAWDLDVEVDTEGDTSVCGDCRSEGCGW